MCTFLLRCWALGATRLRKQKCEFYPPVHNVFFSYWYSLADIRVIFTVNSIMLADNCHGAPWGYAAVLCGLLDGVR